MKAAFIILGILQVALVSIMLLHPDSGSEQYFLAAGVLASGAWATWVNRHRLGE